MIFLHTVARLHWYANKTILHTLQNRHCEGEARGNLGVCIKTGLLRFARNDGRFSL